MNETKPSAEYEKHFEATKLDSKMRVRALIGGVIAGVVVIVLRRVFDIEGIGRLLDALD